MEPVFQIRACSAVVVIEKAIFTIRVFLSLAHQLLCPGEWDLNLQELYSTVWMDTLGSGASDILHSTNVNNWPALNA